MATYMSSAPEDRPPYPKAPASMTMYPSYQPNQTGPGSCSIHQALDTLPAETIVQLLQQNPAGANEKGFSGVSPLHRAALRGEIKIVEALIKNGGDLNAKNDFHETPLHFACKRGNPRILHILLEHGADITAKDKAGKMAMHHAAEGGSVYGMHYLVELHSVSTNILDNKLHTPLHIVCARGHMEALPYLLKKERSDLHQRDMYGNNSLHLAAKFGNLVTCWKLLELAGIKLLHEKNKDGYTPLDMAKQGKEFKFKELVQFLEMYSKTKNTEKIQGPVVVWYWLLFMTTIWYGSTLSIAQLFSKKGWITLVGMVSFGVVGMQQQHRMFHVSRWPNPFFAGFFAAGLLFSTVSYFFNVLPYIYEDHFMFAVLSIFLTPVGYYTYIVLLVRDPGVQRHSAEKEGIGSYYTMWDIAQGNVRMEAFCLQCEIVRMKRTKHCKLCEECLIHMDHHCLFLYRCIARHTHRLFVYFVIMVAVGNALFELNAVMFIMKEFHQYISQSDYGGLMWSLFHSQPMLWSMMLLNLGTLIWAWVLVRAQLRMVSRGHLTVYQPMNRGRGLTFGQRMYNIHRFLSGKPFIAEESDDDDPSVTVPYGTIYKNV